jgi:hypothetical protein
MRVAMRSISVLGLLTVIVLFTAACNPNESTSQSASESSEGCTGSQTVTAHNGDSLTVLVENNVSGSYSTQQVVNVVVDMNSIADSNVIQANQQYRLPTSCTSSSSTSSSTSATSSQGCTGSQTVTAHSGDNLTALVEENVGGSYSTQQVVSVVVDMNSVADSNVIQANQQYRLPTTCGGP